MFKEDLNEKTGRMMDRNKELVRDSLRVFASTCSLKLLKDWICDNHFVLTF